MLKTYLDNTLRRTLPALALVGLLSNCASIVSKSSYPVTVDSTPPGATFLVKNGDGESVTSGTTPASVVLRSSAGYFRPASYTVEFKKGGQTQTVPLDARMSGWYLGNIIFGGLVGILIVDPATGAMWTLNDRVAANFGGTADAGTKAKAGDVRELRVMSLADVPQDLRVSLVAIR